MGTKAARWNSEIQGYMENYSDFQLLIHREDAFWWDVKTNDLVKLTSIRNAQTLAIEG